MDYQVAIFKTSFGEPAFQTDSLDDAFWHIKLATALSNLDPEDLDIVIYEDNEPIYKVVLCNLGEADVVKFEGRDRRG